MHEHRKLHPTIWECRQGSFTTLPDTKLREIGIKGTSDNNCWDKFKYTVLEHIRKYVLVKYLKLITDSENDNVEIQNLKRKGSKILLQESLRLRKCK